MLCYGYMTQHLQGESKKVSPLRLLYIFLLEAILHKRRFTELFAIHILTYVPMLFHLFQYLWELQQIFVTLTFEFEQFISASCSIHKLLLKQTHFINEIIG